MNREGLTRLDGGGWACAAKRKVHGGEGLRGRGAGTVSGVCLAMGLPLRGRLAGGGYPVVALAGLGRPLAIHGEPSGFGEAAALVEGAVSGASVSGRRVFSNGFDKLVSMPPQCSDAVCL